MNFEEFFEDHKEIAVSVARKYKGKGIEWDDLLQMAYIGTYRGYVNLDKANDTRAFIYMNARKYITEEFQRMGRVKRSGITDSLDEEDRNGLTRSSKLFDIYHAGSRENMMAVSEAIKKLPDKHKQIVRLISEGYTNDEIYQQLGFSSTKSLCTIINRIKKKIYAELYPEVEWNESPYFNNKGRRVIRS